jgi:hypothetical protein
MIEPEGEREVQMLTELAGNISFGRPSGTQNRVPSGTASSGSEELFNNAAVGHEASPSSFTGKRHDKQHVVAIDKRP